MTSQRYETYVPPYDAVPENWEEARPFFVEMLRKITDGINVREICTYVNEEIVTGGQFIATTINADNFRDILRWTIPTGPLSTGLNVVNHDINFDSNFTLVKLWVAATDNVNFIASVITDDNVTMLANTFEITSPRDYPFGYVIVEYLLEP